MSEPEQEQERGRDQHRTADGEESTEKGAPGQAVPAPRPDRSPEDVVRTVLSALQTNDDTHENAGITAMFNFSTPGYRAEIGGSLADLVDHLSSPIYRSVVDHTRAKRGRLVQDEPETATEKVVVEDEDGDPSTYEFALTKVDEGKYEGCWMIDDFELVNVGASHDHQHMPVVDFDGVQVKCAEGDLVRDVLLRASGVSPHNSAAKYANCNGNAVCGTCAVEIVDGEVTEKTAAEKRRLNLPPHRDNDNPNFRLSCQCMVLSDLVVHKHGGTWGQHIEEYAAGTEEDPDSDPIRVSEAEYEGTDAAVEDVDGDENLGEMEISDESRELIDETGRGLDDGEDSDADG
jgi:ferredoxin